MAVNPVQSSTQTCGSGATRGFGACQTAGGTREAQDSQAAREAASLLTSQLFFAPLLAEMRKLPFGKEIGYGGRMEDALAEQLDTRIADTVARSDRGLTAWLAEDLAQKQPAPAPDSDRQLAAAGGER